MPDDALKLAEVPRPRIAAEEIAYYARLGWREFDGRLLVRQHGATCEFTFNRIMTRGVRDDGPTSGTIDLCGAPW